MKDCFIVLDLGSSSVRAMAFSADGGTVAVVRRPIRAEFPRPGLAEYDGAFFGDSALGAYHSLLDEIRPAGWSPVSLGVTGQRSTVALWDRASGEILAPFLSWQDGRASMMLDTVSATQDEVHAITGLYKTQYYAAPKIAWAIENLLEVRRAARAGRLCAGPLNAYVVWRLTCGKVFACDPTHAQRMLIYDIHNLRWDDRLISEFGVYASALPEVRPSVGDYGLCADTGIPIRVSIGDQQSAAIGMGVVGAGQSAVNYGTGAFFLANTGADAADVRGLLTSIACQNGDEISYLLEASVNSAGSALDWLKSVGVPFNYDDCEKLCRQSVNPVMFLPALGGLGSPYWDFDVSPVITGILPTTTTADIVRGALDGIAHCIADNVLLMRKSGVVINSGRASGGLSDCDYLLSYQSAIFGFPLERAAVKEITSFGTAYLLARDGGLEPAGWAGLATDRVFMPELGPQEVESALARWRDFSRLSIELGHRLAG
ncbi:MAG: FGGY family carbohydrate kinase [Elusimicrobiaceae bacterium]|nr:FGGY family carbohydrate kinase [Elusimicrobiaceae bacterium]